jgi:hypothetical protein
LGISIGAELLIVWLIHFVALVVERLPSKYIQVPVLHKNKKKRMQKKGCACEVSAGLK